MQPVDFSKLKEYDSLSKREQQLLREISDENARTQKIKSLIEKHLEHRHEIKNNIAQLNTSILDCESQLKTLGEQKDRLMNQGATEEKLKDYQDKIDHFENEAFEFLEKIDQLENELTETLQFETGARKTLSEIEAEVSIVVTSKETEAKNLHSHLEDILNNLPPSLSSSLNKLIAKNLTHGPFTKISDGGCMLCRFKISKTDEAEIDVHKLLKFCPQCSRIFLPYGT